MAHFLQLRTEESITHQEILAFCTLNRVSLLPIEINAILSMDRVAAQAVSEIIKEESSIA